MNNLPPHHVPTSSPIQRIMEKEKEEKKQTEKVPVPGQQIGMYSKNEDKDVRQMVRTLNPEDHSMKSRG